MADQYFYKRLYDLPYNQGMFEGYVNPEDIVLGGNVGNTTFLPRGILNVGGGADVIPLSDDKVQPYGYATYQDQSGLNVTGAIDDYMKSLSAQMGNVGANVKNSDMGTEYGINYNQGLLGGDLSIEASKNPYDSMIRALFTKYF